MVDIGVRADREGGQLAVPLVAVDVAVADDLSLVVEGSAGDGAALGVGVRPAHTSQKSAADHKDLRVREEQSE